MLAARSLLRFSSSTSCAVGLGAPVPGPRFATATPCAYPCASPVRTSYSRAAWSVARPSQLSSLSARRVPAVPIAVRSSAVPVAVRGFSSSVNISESFLGGTNSHYIDEMYLQWRQDPSSVHKSWDVFFKSGNYSSPPAASLAGQYTAGQATAAVGTSGLSSESLALSTRVIQMVRAFQVRGHYMAKLDPLNLDEDRTRKVRTNPKELELSYYGFTEEDLDKPVPLNFKEMKGFLAGGQSMTVRQVYQRLVEAYSGSVGVEYMHIASAEECNWIRERFETRERPEYSKEMKLRILDRLTWAEQFETFLARKYATAKRFGLEGLEGTIVGMKAAIDRLAALGTTNIVMGMPHRGRLNVLSTVVRKPMEQIFAEFAGAGALDETEGSGDVKYHLGMSHVRPTHHGMVRLSLVANPSHLEAVNPVVSGKVKAKQFYTKDENQTNVCGIVLHGDAAFAGQGVVYETLGFQDLPAYSTGGTIHIVCNNQIGFTTDPSYSRSSPYCTEVAKAVGAPIFHVNGDDPEAINRVCELAAEFRQQFKKDVVVDIVGYRKHGHNEIDEPSFTQPKMYSVIKKKASTLTVYQKKLLEEKALSKDEIEDVANRVDGILEQKYDASKSYEPQPSEWLSTQWENMKPQDENSEARHTGVDTATLRAVGQALTAIPKGFNVHRRLTGILQTKKEMITNGADIDWATAEALAFGTILLEEHHVRLSGQDVERGTFSHRHAVLHDQKEPGKTYVPLANLAAGQAPFSISNSHLSEFGVLGFEVGYSMENPRSLVLWEAQFGDFANGAQVMIDQFISSGEAKWRRQCGLVMLLPHGYEGQGPEHSSARLERYLQLTDDNPELELDNPIQKTNWQVVNLTTPANYFHALRRQIHRDFRKPLIVMSPKSLLRHHGARSTFEDMGPGTQLLPVIAETNEAVIKNKNVRRVILCSGKVYFDLIQQREELKAHDVAIVRVEQLAPFPFADVRKAVDSFKKVKDVVWCQEEHRNQGAWGYVNERIETALKGKRARYVGRAPSASTATGSAANHKIELQRFLDEAFAK